MFVKVSSEISVSALRFKCGDAPYLASPSTILEQITKNISFHGTQLNRCLPLFTPRNENRYNLRFMFRLENVFVPSRKASSVLKHRVGRNAR